jgi:uncharacterized membrane protein YdjX (TVP38/TMEM64 family)
MDKKKIKSIIVFGFFLILFVSLTIGFWPFIKSLSSEEGRNEFKNYIDSLGIGGWFIMLGIQILQVVIAFLPGEPIEIVMGVFYGPWMGMVTCLIGILIGTVIIYILAKLIGKPFVRLFIDEEDFKKYKFLQDPRKIEMTVFILFFIPGTPKDALTYIAPFIPIKSRKFFVIATFARIPSVITSTILGNEIIEGNYLNAIIVFVVTAVISILGIIFNNYYTKKKQDEH